MHIRRFLRRGNAFSKKLDHHRAAVSLHIAWYNFVRVHETLRVTPAMEAGITDRVWSVEELVTRALAAEPCEAPQAQPLAPPEPLPGEAKPTARELPNGRGWLRVVDGGKGKGPSNDPPRAPTPPPVVRYATPVVEDPEKHWQEVDAKMWRDREKKMAFFDDEPDDCPY